MKETAQSRVKSSDTRVAPPIVHQVLRSTGKPLDPGIRRSLEPRFGHDFGNVRVHTDERAAASAHAVDARAYAVGSNLVFAHGQYSPDTSSGRQLLAHELAHTVQQRNSAAPSHALPVGEARGGAEQEADRAAQAISADRPISLTAGAAVVARQPADSDTKEPTNLEQVEQALTKFFKDVHQAYPDDPLPQNQLVVTQVLRIAAASKKPPRVGPVREVDPHEVQEQMTEFLKSTGAPRDPEKLAKAVVQRLPGPVDPAEIEHLKAISVFKPDEPKGIPGVIDRYQKLAPAELPAKPPEEQSEDQKQAAAMATQRSNPKLSPPLDPFRIGRAIAGGKEKEKQEYTNPPVPKPEEPIRSGVVNKDIKIPSSVPSLTVDKPIHFQVNQPDTVASDDKTLRVSLTPGGVTDLDMVVRWLQRGPEFGVQLTGMASSEGTPERNRQLGESRVRSIANALLRSGIKAAQIDDVPGNPATCTRLSFGIYNCADSRAAKTRDPNDRQVQARLFVFPKSAKP